MLSSDRSQLLELSKDWIAEASRVQYFHDLTWLGRTIIQVPQDTYAIQELIWSVRPDLIIETGIAHGGSLILSASMLALLDYCDAVSEKKVLDPRMSRRRVIGVDNEIRDHNRKAIEQHPLAHLIEMIEGSSVDPEIVEMVHTRSQNFSRVMVFLDSNHTHEHVLAELKAYTSLVSQGSYVVVWDTGVEDLPDDFVTNRPWGKGNNPKTAVWEFLRLSNTSVLQDKNGGRLVFEIDKEIEARIAITAGPDGFLKRV